MSLRYVVRSMWKSSRVPKALKTLTRNSHKRLLRWMRLYRRLQFCQKVCVLAFILPILIVFWYFIYTKAHTKQLLTSQSKYHEVNGLFRNPSTLRRLAQVESEAYLARKYVCHREYLDRNLQYLGLCGEFEIPSSKKKVVALVEVRNVEPTIDLFLSAVSSIVDSVVLLDDHSTDLSRNAIMSFNTRRARDIGRSKFPFVEVLLNKSGSWIREELFDRHMLLQVGRRIGGTHFVALDYDEYFSANCIESGLLRRSILQLKPGESLYIPWVEVWKSPRVQAVLSDDINMNFLRRRQIVIFADDSIVQYSWENSVAKLLTSSGQRESSMHVLRCPRSLCEQPPPYSGPETLTEWGHVRPLLQCRIVEMRFLNLNNMLLKSVWYEALGRVVGAKDGVTSGKMVNFLLRRLKHSVTENVGLLHDAKDSFSITATDPEWFSGFDERIFEAHTRIETWRAEDVLRWVEEQGYSSFTGLPAMSLVDIARLRGAVELAKENGEHYLQHIPRRFIGTLVVVVDAPAKPVLNDFMKLLKWPEVDLQYIKQKFSESSNEWTNEVITEKWREVLVSSIMEAVEIGTSRRAFISCSVSDKPFTLGVFGAVHDDLPHLNVTVLFGDRIENYAESSDMFKQAVDYSTESESHISLIDIPFASFGSFMSLFWLRTQVESEDARLSAVDSSALLYFAENTHQRYGNADTRLAPVAKLIFSLNVGRSGSRYLAAVLRTALGPVSAIHEASCPGRECTKGGAMRMQDRPLSTSYKMRARVKRPLLRRAVLDLALLRNSAHGGWYRMRMCECVELKRRYDVDPIESSMEWEKRGIYLARAGKPCSMHVVMDGMYVETNPNFKSWFYDVVLDEFPFQGYDVAVVILRKYVAAVLKSLLETGFFTSRDGYTWMETSASVNSRTNVKELANDTLLDAADKLLSYIINAEAAFRDIVGIYSNYTKPSRRNRTIRFVPLRSEALYGANGSLHLFNELDIAPSDLTTEMASQVHDKYGAGGRKRVGTFSFKECERRVQHLIDRTGGSNGSVAGFLQGWSRIDGFDYHES